MAANGRDETQEAPIGSSELKGPALVQTLFMAVFSQLSPVD